MMIKSDKKRNTTIYDNIRQYTIIYDNKEQYRVKYNNREWNMMIWSEIHQYEYGKTIWSEGI